MALTELQIVKAKCPDDKESTKLSDAHGLYLEIYKSGGKLWRYKYYRPSNKKKENRLSLGKYPEVSLKEARLKHAEARAMVARGIDPAQHKKAIKEARTEDNENTFEVLAREWFNRYLHQEKWVESHSKRIIRRLERNIFPSIGHMPIKDITKQQLISAIDKVFARGVNETGRRALQDCDQIYRHAILTDRAEINIASNIKPIFPTVNRQKHFPAITEPERLGELLRMMDVFKGSPSVTCAFHLMPYVFVRTLELRRMRWEDVNFSKSEWSHFVTKTQIDHIVPLSKQAIKILKEIESFTKGSEYVFASETSKLGYINENALLNALRSLEVSKEEMTIHGWRATAKTLLEEKLDCKPAVVEHQIAHKHFGPYDRTKYLKERKEMMQAWADYLDGLKATK
jgi:integrase